MEALAVVDSSDLRKARGAFFTPREVTDFVADWSIRTADDRVLEPSTGEAAFLVSAVERLRDLAGDSEACPRVDGVEIHSESAIAARSNVARAGGVASISVGDFFEHAAVPKYDAVIGNPPFIRFQSFSGESRLKARAATARAGVTISAMASSWAAFTIHAAQFLAPRGRLGIVLPAELLSVNYAAEVRRYLLECFASVTLVTFERQVFPDAEADVVLVLADGFGEGPTDFAVFRQAVDAAGLASLPGGGTPWRPDSRDAKWTGSDAAPEATEPLRTLLAQEDFAPLEAWGETTLGMVTGNNKYFAMSPDRALQLGLEREELVAISPPGSAHLRNLEITSMQLRRLGEKGKATLLFSPGSVLSPAATTYIKSGELAGVDTAYKCRVRKDWYRVSLIPPADILLTAMNGSAPQLVSNKARVAHLNSVYGVYLKEEHRQLGRTLLPVAALNSVSLLNAEMVGRSYGGGILKLEPREADRWCVPSPQLIGQRWDELSATVPRVRGLLQHGKFIEAVAAVDDALFGAGPLLSESTVASVRTEWERSRSRRATRGRYGS